MFKRLNFKIILIIVLILPTIASQSFTQTTELERLKITQNRLIDYLNQLKPDLNLTKQVDTTIVRIADITFDGKVDSIFIKFSAKSILHKFVWNYKIFSEGNLIYFKENDDPYVDNGFGRNKSPKLDFYLKEKTNFYFVNIPNNIIRERVFYKNDGILSKEYNSGIYYLFPEQLKRLGITNERTILKIIDRTAERLKNGTYILQPPINSFQTEFIRIFVPEVNTFLIIYKG